MLIIKNALRTALFPFKQRLKRIYALTVFSFLPFFPFFSIFEFPVNQEPEVRVISEEEESNRVKKRYIPDEKEMELLARAVYSEARGESFEGQVAVASVILNRLESEDFPNTISGVIFQPRAFTAVQDGQFWLEPGEEAFKAVEKALEGDDPSGGAFYYYNPVKATSSWIYSRTVIKRIGGHLFAE